MGRNNEIVAQRERRAWRDNLRPDRDAVVAPVGSTCRVHTVVLECSGLKHSGSIPGDLARMKQIRGEIKRGLRAAVGGGPPTERRDGVDIAVP